MGGGVLELVLFLVELDAGLDDLVQMLRTCLIVVAVADEAILGDMELRAAGLGRPG